MQNFHLSGKVSSRATWLAPYFVWSVWALLFSAALAFIWRFGSDVPYWDEWNIVEILVGHRAIDAHWLWSEHNGHRIPLPRLLLLALYWLSGSDFRVGMYFNVAALGVLSLAMIWVAKVKRGRTALSDAFFPLLLLHWGHYENLLWSWQVTQVLPVLIACLLLLIIVVNGLRLTFRLTLVSGILIVLLPLCGVPGLAYAPAFLLWLTLVAVRRQPSSDPACKGRRFIILAFLMIAALEVTIYIVGYHEATSHLSVFNLKESAMTALQFLTAGFGPAVQQFWPYSGLVMLGFWLLTGGLLGRQLWRDRLSDRSYDLALVCFMLGLACLTLSVGLGRRGYGFAPRYGLIAAPALCWMYYSWFLSRSLSISAMTQAVLFVIVAVLAPLNFLHGLQYGREYHQSMEAFRSDLLAGVPTSQLLARHAPVLCPCPFGREPTWGMMVVETTAGQRPHTFPPELGKCVAFHTWLEQLLTALRRQGIGYFKALKNGRENIHEVAYTHAGEFESASDQALLSGQGVTTHSNGVILFQQPTPIIGLRITYRGDLSPARRPPCLQVFWKKADQTQLIGSQRYIHYWMTNEREQTIWIYDTIDEVVLNLDNRHENIDLLDVRLLVEQDSGLYRRRL